MAVSFLLLITTSCTDVDNTLGSDLIPEDQQMAMKYTMFKADFMDAYMIKQDSMITSNISTGLVGSLYDDVYGKTSAEFACQYISYGIYNTKELGYAPVADSLVMTLVFDGLPEGDTSKTQIINIYPLKEKLIKGDTYYASGNLDHMVDFTNKLASFEYRGATHEISLTLTSEKAQAIMNQMVDTTGGVYDDSDLWYDRFPGLYFKADESSPVNASIINFSMDSSVITLHGRNFTDASAKTVKDTFYMITTFWVNSEKTPNSSAIVFKHDYTGTSIDPSVFNDTLNPLSKTYIKGMDGPLALFEFRETFINDLKALLIPPYKTLVISKAYLEIHNEETDITRLNNSIKRLGLYSDFYHNYTPIRDYYYSYENEGNAIAYGGYLNRTTNNYGMDITAFIQQLVTNDEPEKQMQGGPSTLEILDSRGAILNTSTSPDNPNPMTLKVTYTLIK